MAGPPQGSKGVGMLVLICCMTSLAVATSVPLPSREREHIAAKSTEGATVHPICRRCYAGTAGVCQQSNTICAHLSPEGVCPPDSQRCVCPNCAHGTEGPCHADNGTCGAYADAGTSRCPASTFECYVDTPSVFDSKSCLPCFESSAGPCQHPGSRLCFPYKPASLTCPVGTISCSRYDLPELMALPSTVCPNCAPQSSGPCQGSDGVCWGFFAGTALCPAGTSACYVETTVLDAREVSAGGTSTVTVEGGLEGIYTVTLSGSNYSALDAMSSVATATNVCGNLSFSTVEPGQSACLSVVVTIPENGLVNVSIQMPSELIRALDSNINVRLISLDGNNGTCASRSQQTPAGTVTGTNCSTGRYGLVLDASKDPLFRVNAQDIVLICVVTISLAVATLGCLYTIRRQHRKQLAKILPISASSMRSLRGRESPLLTLFPVPKYNSQGSVLSLLGLWKRGTAAQNRATNPLACVKIEAQASLPVEAPRKLNSRRVFVLPSSGLRMESPQRNATSPNGELGEVVKGNHVSGRSRAPVYCGSGQCDVERPVLPSIGRRQGQAQVQLQSPDPPGHLQRATGMTIKQQVRSMEHRLVPRPRDFHGRTQSCKANPGKVQVSSQPQCEQGVDTKTRQLPLAVLQKIRMATRPGLAVELVMRQHG